MTELEKAEITGRINGSFLQWQDGAICAHEMANYVYGQASLLPKWECCDFPCTLEFKIGATKKFKMKFDSRSEAMYFVSEMLDTNSSVSSWSFV